MSADVAAELARLRLELAATRSLLFNVRRALVELGCADAVLLRRLNSLFPRHPCIRAPRRGPSTGDAA